MKRRWRVAILVSSLLIPLGLPPASPAQVDGDRLTLRYDMADGVFKGRLRSARGRCKRERTIKVFGKRGRDRKLVGKDESNRFGRYRVRRSVGRGRYFAKARPEGGCEGKRSPTKRVALGIAARPALYPEFSRGIKDYVVRCQAGRRVTLSVAAPDDVRVSVDGRAPRTGVFRTRVGVRTGQRFDMSVRTGPRVTRHHVRCLPPDFPAWKTGGSGTARSQWYIVTPGPSSYVAIYDTNGVPVWWLHTRGHLPIDAKLLPNGHLAWARRFDATFGISPEGAYEEHRLDGTLVRTLSTVGTPTDFHDLLLMPNGSYMLVSYKARDGVDLSEHGGPADATVLDAEIQVITRRGRLVWRWNSQHHIGLNETTRWDEVIKNPARLPDGRKAYDHVHINSIELQGGRIVLSARHLDAIYEIDTRTRQVTWKLGGTSTPKSLELLGDPRFASTSFGGQHDARVLSDGTVTLHDNGSGRNRPPRAVRFRIDRRARTATLLEQVTDPQAASSFCCGGARKLPGGNWVTSWGGVPLVGEYSPSGRRVFSLAFQGDSVFSYRAVPVLPGVLSRAALRGGMDAMHPR